MFLDCQACAIQRILIASVKLRARRQISDTVAERDLNSDLLI